MALGNQIAAAANGTRRPAQLGLGGNARMQGLAASRAVDPNVARVRAMNPAQQAMFGQWVKGLQAQPQAPGGLGLPGMQETQFGEQRNRINEGYAGGLNDNQFQLNQALNQFRQMGQDLNAGQLIDRNARPSQFQRRGMLGSGLDNRSLTGLLTGQQRAADDLTARRSGALGTIHAARQSLLDERDQKLAGVEAARQRALAGYAQQGIR